MTKPEYRNPKEARMTIARHPDLRHSLFGFRHSFGFPHSDFVIFKTL